MAFSSRRRNYLLTPHRKDGLIEWMKDMLNHSFVLDCLDTTAPDTFSHFEMLIEEHRFHDESNGPSRLRQLVPTVGTFHTHLPLRKAFIAYNKKYALTKRKFITISFNELRHILNLAQIMALRGEDDHDDDNHEADRRDSLHTSLKEWANSPGFFHHDKDVLTSHSPPTEFSLGDPAIQESAGPTAEEKGTSSSSTNDDVSSMSNKSFRGPTMITFDGDQTLYRDGANFEGNPQLANYLYLLLRHGVTLAVVTAAGYEYNTEKYELRLSGLLSYFKSKNLPEKDCERFYLFGGECNFLLKLGPDYKLHPVKEYGPGGWKTATKFIQDTPGNWNEDEIQSLLDIAETTIMRSMKELRLRGSILRKKRAVGLYPRSNQLIPREALDEIVLRVHEMLNQHKSLTLPFCAFNGGSDVWVDVGNKRVGVEMLAAYLGIAPDRIIHVGDQFLNTGNDHAARGVCPCIWITNPEETTYILKSILRLAGVPLDTFPEDSNSDEVNEAEGEEDSEDYSKGKVMNFKTFCQRASMTNLDGLAALNLVNGN